MSQNNAVSSFNPPGTGRPGLYPRNSRLSQRLFMLLLLYGLAFAALSLYQDIAAAGVSNLHFLPFLLLGLALLTALAFEFVNGFHDTANAVATVIYTHSLPPTVAVVWSGMFNFLGVMLSSGVVAWGIISLLPMELLAQASSGHGFAMIYALLFSAMIWNLGTWWLGLPSSSSHTLIGSIIGVGVANALMQGQSGVNGVNWEQARSAGYALLLSPVIGFACAALLLLMMKLLVRNRQLYRAPQGNTPPPLWIRGMLILTCTGVSFAHGSNDGQKGMGLIMLILVGSLPSAYSLYDDSHVIPLWVKVVVAIALALGTLVGWRRIVLTVGEKIGKAHLSYAQGASAELVAMGTIGAADAFGLPVSTTHVLSSGVAGTMAANGSGVQMATLRNLLIAWVLTLPASVLLSALLFWLFSQL
ncbi:inorganic phosphate transporter [Erwinia sp. V71]|uniref:inorganic phosphate transporter n=1 Tax=Erwinia sp. V71 TaxID=3369424 RepID=UPI003F5FE90C